VRCNYFSRIDIFSVVSGTCHVCRGYIGVQCDVEWLWKCTRSSHVVQSLFVLDF
jgi:hypothetical protein